MANLANLFPFWHYLSIVMILENFYHGSPYEFDNFDISKVGSGDSRSKFGWGLYFTDSPNTALKYAKELSIGKLKDAGFNIYEVKLLGLDSFYEWDSEIPESLAQDVVGALIKAGHEDSAEQFQTEIQEYGLWTMDSLYQYLEAILGGKKEASEFLFNYCNVNGVVGQTAWLEGNVYVAFSDRVVKMINHTKSDDMQPLDEVRKIVRELFESKSMNEEILEEDYNSIKEIKELANQTLIFIAKVNLEAFLRQVKSNQYIDYVMPIRLLEVYQENPRKFQTLSDFLVDTNIYVKVSKAVRDSGVLGHYTRMDEPEYDKGRTREIVLFPDSDFYNKLTEDYSKEKEHDYRDAYFTMWYAFHSTLEHEIQHAYDDYRSKSKLFQARKTKEYNKKHTMANGRPAVYANPELNQKKHQEYLKLQHEIWARFTQAVNETRFTKGDFATSPDGVDYFHYQMKPLAEVIKDFTIHFNGWRIMPDSVKKKLAARVSAYWHKEMENLDKKNQESIEREKEVLSRESQLSEIRGIIQEAFSNSLDGYRKWKRKNVMVRGISSDGTLDTANGSGARFGEGLYMAPLSNMKMAKQYGKLYFVVNGKPKNPMVFRDTNLAEIWIQQNLIFKNYKNSREFEANTSIAKEMLKLGYDGIEIKGRETVNFAPPENVMYFATENGLIDYYERAIENKSIDENLNEDYPSSFDMEHFKTLKTFKERVAYCNSNLKRLSSGSSRIVYQIDDQKVLKLAKNNKGIVQNEGEIDAAEQSYYSNIAEIFDYDENGLWVEMELARKVTPEKFKSIVGFDINDVRKYLQAFQASTQGKSTSPFRLNSELERQIMQNEFVDSLREYIANTDALAGDIGTISSFGLVNRGGEDELVLVDFGLSENDFEKLYREGTILEANDTNLWTYGGIVLIKGKEQDGLQNLYACHIISLMQLDRKKKDDTPGKPARMVVLDSNVFRIVNIDGQLKALKVDFKNFASLSRTFMFNGRQSHAVTLNNNKTPIHWETLKYNNFPELFSKAGNEIINIPGIKWTL